MIRYHTLNTRKWTPAPITMIKRGQFKAVKAAAVLFKKKISKNLKHYFKNTQGVKILKLDNKAVVHDEPRRSVAAPCICLFIFCFWRDSILCLCLYFVLELSRFWCAHTLLYIRGLFIFCCHTFGAHSLCLKPWRTHIICLLFLLYFTAYFYFPFTVGGNGT